MNLYASGTCLLSAPDGNVQATLKKDLGGFFSTHAALIGAMNDILHASSEELAVEILSRSVEAPASTAVSRLTQFNEVPRAALLRICGIDCRPRWLTSDEDPSIEENTGILYVVPAGGGVPTPALKNAALRQVTEVYPCTLTFQPAVQDPVY